MRYRIKENRKKHFVCGAVLLAAGLVLYLSNMYVATPFFSGVMNIGGVRVYSGVFAVPLVISVVWLFLAPAGKKKAPLISGAIGVLVLVAAGILSVSIRLRPVPIIVWVLIVAALLAGIILMLSSLKAERWSGKRKD